jgi:hypothetical protein
MDEMRVGQKGRTTRRWWIRGRRPAGLCDKRFASAYLFAAARPGTGQAFALALPFVSTAAMQRWLDGFAATLAPGAHAALVLDRAGWHGAHSLVVPESVTLIPLPAYAPELNPIERLWLYLRERYLSHRLFADHEAVLDACCRAWNALTDEAGRIASLTSYPYLQRVSS